MSQSATMYSAHQQCSEMDYAVHHGMMHEAQYPAEYVGAGEELYAAEESVYPYHQAGSYDPREYYTGAEQEGEGEQYTAPVPSHPSQFTVSLIHPCGVVAQIACPPGAMPSEMAARVLQVWGWIPRDGSVLALARVEPLQEALPLGKQISAWETLHAIPPPAGFELRPQRWKQQQREAVKARLSSPLYVGVVHVSGEAGWVAYSEGYTGGMLRADVASRWGSREDAFVLARATTLQDTAPMDQQCTHMEALHPVWMTPLLLPDAAGGASPPPEPAVRKLRVVVTRRVSPESSLPLASAPSAVLPGQTTPGQCTRSSSASGETNKATTAPDPADSMRLQAAQGAAMLLHIRSQRKIQRTFLRRWRSWLQVRHELRGNKSSGENAASRSSSEQSTDSTLPPHGLGDGASTCSSHAPSRPPASKPPPGASTSPAVSPRGAASPTVAPESRGDRGASEASPLTTSR